MLSYQLTRLVATKDQYHILHHKKTETIEVIPNTYMYFKIITKEMLAPGKINFTYGDGQYVKARRTSIIRSNTLNNASLEPESPTKSPTKSPTRLSQPIRRTPVELNVYFSTTEKNREPQKENCEKAVENPNGTITLPIQGKDKFVNDEVYLSLLSINGCTVHITVSFPEIKIQNFTRKTIKDDLADEAEFENFLVCKNWRRMNKNRANDKDYYIKEHVQTVGNHQSNTLQRAKHLAEKRDLLVQE